MQISSIAGATVAAPPVQSPTVTSQSAPVAPTASGRAAPQDVVSLSHAAQQAMNGIDTDGDGH